MVMPVYGILVRIEGLNNNDKAKDERATFKRGDIIHVYRGEQCQEAFNQSLPHGVVLIDLPITYEKLLSLTEPEMDGFDKIIRKRKWRLNIDMLPNRHLRELENTRKVALTRTQLENILEHKRLHIPGGLDAALR